MGATPAIELHNLGKAFHLGETFSGRQTLRECAYRTLARGWADARTNRRLRDRFWAIRNLGLKVEEGEALGVIGANGAGKSTLLKLLSGITPPTEGRATLRGTLASLLEVGTGFHPELTGRENIFLNGAILGMSRSQIRRSFDAIVDFAEVASFLDTPVKRYSSGMYTRLAFSVAAHLAPDILVIDEVLAVGDARFQARCMGKMGEAARRGRTVIFVSHNMSSIRHLCDRAILLERGQLRAEGRPAEIIETYLSGRATQGGRIVWPEGHCNDGVDSFAFHAARLLDPHGRACDEFDVRKPITVELEYEVRKPLPFARVGVMVTTSDGIELFESYDSDDDAQARAREPGRYRCSCTIPGDLLAPRTYHLTINAGVPKVANLACVETALAFSVTDTGAAGANLLAQREGLIRPRLQWRQRTCERSDHAAAA